MDLKVAKSVQREDMSTTKFRWTHNHYFVAPENFATKSKPHDGMFEYAVDVDTLMKEFVQLAKSQPLTKEVFCDDEKKQFKIIQKTPKMKYTDVITVQFLPTKGSTPDAPMSTMAVYSRSVLGYDDLKCNKKRVEHWLAEFNKAVPPVSTSRNASV